MPSSKQLFIVRSVSIDEGVDSETEWFDPFFVEASNKAEVEVALTPYSEGGRLLAVDEVRAVSVDEIPTMMKKMSRRP